MKNFLWQNKVLLTALLGVFVVCVIVIVMRIGVESESKKFDIVLDFGEIEAMAQQTEYDTEWWLRQFYDRGIVRVGLLEENLMSMTEDPNIDLHAQMVGNLILEARWRENYPASVLAALNEREYLPFDVLVEARGDAAAFVTHAITERFREGEFEIIQQGQTTFILMHGTPDVALYSARYAFMNSRAGGFIQRIDIRSSILMYISLGLWPERVELIQYVGMEIIPRTLAYDGFNDTQFAQAVVDGWASHDIIPRYLIAGGQAVIGFDDGIEFMRDFVLEHDIIVGLIENTTQLQNILQSGIVDITVQSDFNAVRVFSTWDYIQNRYQIYGYEGAEEIVNTFFRAITERNIRIIYYRPIRELRDFHTYVTDIETYHAKFDSLFERLDRHGFSLGVVEPMQPFKVSLLFKILFGFGAIIAAVLLLRTFWPMRERTSILLALLGCIGVAGAFYVMPNTSELLTALATAIIFGCLGTVFFTARSKHLSDKYSKDTSVFKIIGLAITTLLGAVVIAIIGGMLTAAPLSSIGYLLELDIFRGVVVSRLIPMAFFAIAFLAYFGYGSRKTTSGKLEVNDINDLVNLSVKVWMLILAGVFGAVGYYYIARTGHDTGVEVSDFEMLARNLLEYMLLARPRTQEFLVAFPAIMLMVYAAIRRFKIWSIMFGLAGIIGVTSVINTFMHLRTPLYLTFARTGYSILFGIVIGAVAVLMFELAYKIYTRYIKKYIEIKAEK